MKNKYKVVKINYIYNSKYEVFYNTWTDDRNAVFNFQLGVDYFIYYFPSDTT